MHTFASIIRMLTLLLLCVTHTVPRAAHAQTNPGERYVLLVGGLGGDENYSATFEEYLFETRQAFIEQFQVPENNITVLAENENASERFITDVSTAENIRKHFETLAQNVDENDQVYILLFGHGSFDGQHARLNIPRRDLSDADFAQLVDLLQVERTVFVNTASSSGPFAETLNGPDRIIITATRSGRQRNETMFPQFFIESFSDPAADIDQNDRLSVKEAFQYAAQKTAQWFSDQGHVASEHALLEDTGDGQGTRLNELEQAADGNLAAATYFHPPSSPAVAAEGANSDSSAALQSKKRALEKEIAALKGRKTRMSEETYYEQLEKLLVQLARLSHSADSTRKTN